MVPGEASISKSSPQKHGQLLDQVYGLEWVQLAGPAWRL